MELTGEQHKELTEALTKAFHNEKRLAQMLKFHLGKDLATISATGNLWDDAFELIRVAQAEGWIIGLVKAARKANPKNARLKAFEKKIFGEPTEEPFSKSERGIEIPIVLLTMTSSEANDLDVGKAFKNYPEEIKKDFFEFKDSILLKELPNWKSRYKEEIIDWQPLNPNKEPRSIAEIIYTELSELNEERSELLTPKFMNIAELNDKLHRKKLLELRKKNCVVVVDAISLRHPLLQRNFALSLLEASPNALVISISPLASVFDVMNNVVIYIERFINFELHRRYRIDKDPKCKEVYSPTELNRFIALEIPKLFPEGINNYFFS